MFTKNTTHSISAMAIFFALIAISCHKDDIKSEQQTKQTESEATLKAMIPENGSNPDELATVDVGTAGSAGYLYTESNDATQNSIVVYKQQDDGRLAWYKTVASGGAGNGKSLGSQGALVLDSNHQWLYAVNAGANSVSSFWVNRDGSVTLAHTAPSGGTTPVSLTVRENVLYVVNATSANISGLQIGAGGSLTSIMGSSQNLSSPMAAPAQISFHPQSWVLYVTEKMTNKIATFKVDAAGVANPGVFHPSVGYTPFGFDFAQHSSYLIVSNAGGSAPNGGSCTSYSTDWFGHFNAINGPVPDFQTAPCWVATTLHGRFAFTTNAGSNTISSYYVSPFGGLYLIFFTIAPTGKAPIDIIVSGNNRYVYAINSGSHTISEYRRKPLGILKNIGDIENIPSYASGLAAF